MVHAFELRKLSVKIGTLLIVVVSLFVVSIHPVYATEYRRQVQKEITIIDENTVSVTETQDISFDGHFSYFPANKNYQYFTIYPPLASQENELMAKVNNITVLDEYGRSLSFEKSMQNDGLEIKVPFYKDLSYKSALRFKLNYTTPLLIKKEGGVLEILHNAISKDFKLRQKSSSGNYEEVYVANYSFIIPKSMGTPDFYTPKTGIVDTNATNTVIHFTQDNLIDNVVRITVGKKRTFKFVLKVNVKKTNYNAHSLFKEIINNQIQLALPGDYFVNDQKVYFTKISPTPEKITTDVDGNLLASIPVSATSDTQVTIEGYAELNRQRFNKADLEKWKISDVPADFSQYTQASFPDWPTQDQQITAIATKLKDPSGSMVKSVDNAVTFVTDTLEYKTFSSGTELRRLGALGALLQKKGVCMEYSDLLLTLLRAMGIPTRNVYGDGVGSLIDRSINGVGHQWVEVWFPEQGWVPIDPTWSENGYIVEGPDLDHFVWYKTSESPDKPSGFSCITWDDQSPCENNITIDTSAVDSIPTTEKMQTVSQLVKEVNQKESSSWKNLPVVSPVIQYLGESYFGRFLLNNVSMNLVLIVSSYFVLLLLVRWVVGVIRRKKAAENTSVGFVPLNQQQPPVTQL